MKKIFDKYSNIKWIAHRGFSSKILENTNESFLLAAKNDFFGIETDLHLTTDNIPILHHDDNFVRLAGVDTNVKDMNLKEISKLKLKDQYKISLLSEYLNICKEYNKYPIIELKPIFNAKELDFIISEIEKVMNIDDVIIISFHVKNLVYLREKYPKLNLQHLTGKVTDEIIDKAIKNRWDLSVQYKSATKELIEILHKENLKLAVWTVNNLEDAKALIDIGVDYITTDGIF